MKNTTSYVLKKLLAEDKPKVVLQNLLELSAESDRDLHNEIIMVAARLRDYEKMQSKGIAVFSELVTEKAKIHNALLSIIDNLSDELILSETMLATETEGLMYRLGNVMPDNWTPFIPVRIRDKAGNVTNETRLQRGQMPNQPLPNGQILKDTPPRRGGYLIREEEVSRIGTIIERSWQRSRWLNGKTFTWIGRRKIAGRMEISSGLAWDFVVRE